MKIRSDYAILDVLAGRAALRKEILKGNFVPVVIHGYVDTAQNDDGTSQEFTVQVQKVEVGAPARSFIES